MSEPEMFIASQDFGPCHWCGKEIKKGDEYAGYCGVYPMGGYCCKPCLLNMRAEAREHNLRESARAMSGSRR